MREKGEEGAHVPSGRPSNDAAIVRKVTVGKRNDRIPLHRRLPRPYKRRNRSPPHARHAMGSYRSLRRATTPNAPGVHHHILPWLHGERYIYVEWCRSAASPLYSPYSGYSTFSTHSLRPSRCRASGSMVAWHRCTRITSPFQHYIISSREEIEIMITSVHPIPDVNRRSKGRC